MLSRIRKSARLPRSCRRVPVSIEQKGSLSHEQISRTSSCLRLAFFSAVLPLYKSTDREQSTYNQPGTSLRLQAGNGSMMLLRLTGSSVLYAQGVLDEIQGTVIDFADLPLPCPITMVTDMAKGWTRVLHSDGEYELPTLVPNSISVAVEAPNFIYTVRTGITLQAGQQAQIDFKLETGDATQTIGIVVMPSGYTPTTAPGYSGRDPQNRRTAFERPQLLPTRAARSRRRSTHPRLVARFPRQRRPANLSASPSMPFLDLEYPLNADCEHGVLNYRGCILLTEFRKLRMPRQGRGFLSAVQYARS
jgi:hypothetical protein